MATHRSRQLLLDEVLHETHLKLSEEACQPFEPNSAIQTDMLETLWASQFPHKPYCPVSEDWGDLGFQGKDPTTDLRGAGLMGLRQLTCFTTSFHALPVDCPSDFPVAIASINITGILQHYFHLNLDLCLSSTITSGSSGCSDLVRDSFLRLQASHPRAVDLLHAQLLLHLAAVWTGMQGPDTTMLNFPYALQATYSHLHLAIAHSGPSRVLVLHDVVRGLDVAQLFVSREGNRALGTLEALQRLCVVHGLQEFLSMLLLLTQVLASRINCCAGAPPSCQPERGTHPCNPPPPCTVSQRYPAQPHAPSYREARTTAGKLRAVRVDPMSFGNNCWIDSESDLNIASPIGPKTGKLIDV